MADLKYYDILFEPVTSEKSLNLHEIKRYTFYVHPDSTKTQIKEAVEKLFNGAEVDSVHTFNLKGKPKRRGATSGYRPKRKKAIVQLTEGCEPLDIFGV
jgi:large subunit ribosomal protein L23